MKKKLGLYLIMIGVSMLAITTILDLLRISYNMENEQKKEESAAYAVIEVGDKTIEGEIQDIKSGTRYYKITIEDKTYKVSKDDVILRWDE